MHAISFKYENTAQIDKAHLQSLILQLSPAIDHLTTIRNTNYETEYASINLPFDEELIKTIFSTAKEKKSLSPTTLVVIGIGGSNLGTMAILQALRGKFYNNHHDDINVYFVDTVDSDNVADIADLVERELDTGNNIIINVISKSGTTTETIANFEIFLEILKSHRPYNYHQFIVATTDEGSTLWQLAEIEEFTILAIPKNVGGRYSVFSAVGLFPLYFLNIDIKALCEGARTGFEIATLNTTPDNYAAISAALIAYHYNQKKIIHDTFIFSAALENIGAWYRQLSAESIGKSHDRDNKVVHIGLLPTVSIGSNDLHSVAQLYFAGPDNRFTTFISVEKNKTHLEIANFPEFENVVPSIQNRPLSIIMDAILQGTKKAYFHDNHPFVSFIIPEKSAFYIGQFMQIKMIEMMYLGFFLNVNPFDQPEIEKYKKETRTILSTPAQ